MKPSSFRCAKLVRVLHADYLRILWASANCAGLTLLIDELATQGIAYVPFFPAGWVHSPTVVVARQKLQRH